MNKNKSASKASPASTGSASDWMRAIWRESERSEFEGIAAFWKWYLAMIDLQDAGYPLRRGGVH